VCGNPGGQRSAQGDRRDRTLGHGDILLPPGMVPANRHHAGPDVPRPIHVTPLSGPSNTGAKLRPSALSPCQAVSFSASFGGSAPM
jgi:hypothetical protein